MSDYPNLDGLHDEERRDRLRAASFAGLSDADAHRLRGENADELEEDARLLRAQLDAAASAARGEFEGGSPMDGELRRELAARRRAAREFTTKQNGANHA